MTIEITREELYEAVWDRPVRKVAAELQISDVALGKICRKHDIPLPGRGYWARVQAGQTLSRRRLPKRSDVRQVTIRIMGKPKSWVDQELNSETNAKLKQLAESSDDTLDILQSPFALRLERRLRTRRADGGGMFNVSDASLFHVCIGSESVDRVVQIVSRLCHLAEAADFEVQSTDEGSGFEIDGQFVSVQISEILERVPHALTEKELRQKERWDKKCRKLQKAGAYIPAWEAPKIPEWDHVPSGRLEVRVDDGTHYDGLRRRFTDGKNQRTERLLPKIIQGAAACAAAAKARRKERERREEERRLAQLRYEEQKRIEALEEKREELLDRVKADWLAADEIDRFADLFLERHETDELSDGVRQFLSWVRLRSERLRERSSSGRLTVVIERLDLMNDEASVCSWERI